MNIRDERDERYRDRGFLGLGLGFCCTFLGIVLLTAGIILALALGTSVTTTPIEQPVFFTCPGFIDVSGANQDITSACSTSNAIIGICNSAGTTCSIQDLFQADQTSSSLGGSVACTGPGSFCTPNAACGCESVPAVCQRTIVEDGGAFVFDFQCVAETGNANNDDDKSSSSASSSSDADDVIPSSVGNGAKLSVTKPAAKKAAKNFKKK